MISDFIIYIATFLVVGTLVFFNIKGAIKYKKAISALLQIAIEKAMLLEQVAKLANENSTKDIEKTDGFLKFVSESRDWAFQYIENAQETINKFVLTTDEILGNINSKTSKSEYAQAVKQISEAYEEIKSLLPQEKQNNN